jgi:hypothetical protein
MFFYSVFCNILWQLYSSKHKTVFSNRRCRQQYSFKVNSTAVCNRCILLRTATLVYLYSSRRCYSRVLLQCIFQRSVTGNRYILLRTATLYSLTDCLSAAIFNVSSPAPKEVYSLADVNNSNLQWIW